MPTKKSALPHQLPVTSAFIERRIYEIRGKQVMLDNDLAELYDVETFNLNKAVKRNLDRFPTDFMFQLTATETESLRFQIGISKPSGRGGRRYLPYVFTQEGVAMLSSVLNSDRAIQVNVAIMRAFVQLRVMLTSHKDLARKLDTLENKYDEQFSVVFKAIRKLMTPSSVPPERRIGFRTSK
jgi:hypothetical protein